MTPSPHRPPTRKLASRLALAGMGLAVVALGALAVWGAIVSQKAAQEISSTGVQTSGHLRAIQALSRLDSSTDVLEERLIPAEVERLRSSQHLLGTSLARMSNGEVREVSQTAAEGSPIFNQLQPALNHFLARPVDSEVTIAAEEELETHLTELQLVLNDLDTDPSVLLAAKLRSVTASERAVRRTAYVLIPLGLGSVVACGWLLSVYRRRSEATMLSAIDASAEEARTDQLTGLPNRRALLEEFASLRAENEPFTLTLADLNGFKRYNDTFGHPAGDALLRRLGRKLAAACEGRGTAGRLGGDEFCVLLPGNRPAGEAHALLTDALSEVGEGFRITAASGMAAVPEEARDVSMALRLADNRMYAAKMSTQPSPAEGLTVALTRMLDERHPGLASHVEEVAALALECAEELRLPADDIRTVKRAAELHDLGKVGVPSAILTKAGPLNDEEWEFMRRHSIIGERILSGVPSLERVAALVRSSHERWDGRGYPDGLAGDEIPIGARIIFVADAFCAMTEKRPYATARSIETTCQELRACSGTQFDPAVVEAFLEVQERRSAQAEVDAPPVLALA